MVLKTLAKNSVYASAHRCGLNAALRFRHRDRLLVVNYHGVVSNECTSARLLSNARSYLHRNAISVARFRRQLQILRRHFTPVSAEEVLEWLSGARSLLPHAVLVTFDDGFRNNLTLAAPELERAGLPALFNVPTGYIGRRRVLWMLELDMLILKWPEKELPVPGRDTSVRLPQATAQRTAVSELVRNACKRVENSVREEYIERLRERHPVDTGSFGTELIEHLTWDEVRELQRRGFAIGSHTVSHPILTQLQPAELDHELTESKRQIERELQAECPWIAYPNGGPDDYSPAVLAACRKAGYEAGFTLAARLNPRGSDPLSLSRQNIVANLSEVEFHARLSGLHGWLWRRGGPVLRHPPRADNQVGSGGKGTSWNPR